MLLAVCFWLWLSLNRLLCLRCHLPVKPEVISTSELRQLSFYGLAMTPLLIFRSNTPLGKEKESATVVPKIKSQPGWAVTEKKYAERGDEDLFVWTLPLLLCFVFHSLTSSVPHPETHEVIKNKNDDGASSTLLSKYRLHAPNTASIPIASLCC